VVADSQLDLFFAVAGEIKPKSVQDLSRVNWFSLTKKRRIEPIVHRVGDDYIRITAVPEYGIASVWDNDLLLFITAQLMRAVNNNQPVSRQFQFFGWDYYKFTGKKSTGGRAYAEMWDSLQRLHHTHIETSIRTTNGVRNEHFNWLSRVGRVVGSKGTENRGFEVEIPDWFFDSIVKHKNILTIESDYFKIKGSLERWLYLFARKSAGKQRNGWEETLVSLHKKSGTNTPFIEFKRQISKIIQKGSIVDYKMEPSYVFDRNEKKQLSGVRFTLQKRI